MITQKVYALRWHVFSTVIIIFFCASLLFSLWLGQSTGSKFVALLDDAPRVMRYLLADGSYSQIEKLYPETIALHKSEFIDPVIIRAQKRTRLEKLVQTHPQSRELISQLYQLAKAENNLDEVALRRAQLEHIDPLFIVE